MLKSKPILTPEEIPTSGRELKEYFRGFRVPTNKSRPMVYTNVYLVSNQEFTQEIVKGEYCPLQDFYHKCLGGCYSKPLDKSENPRDVGVLLYSGNFTDLKAVQKILNEKLIELGTKVEIGVKLKSVQAKIFTGVKMEKVFEKTFHRKEWMMIHLEVDQSVLRSAKKWILQDVQSERKKAA
jgi:hypothetical protein